MADPENEGKFPRQLTPDDEFYRALLSVWIKPGGNVSPGAFSNRKRSDRLSVDWAEKTTPEQSDARWMHRGVGRGIASITVQDCHDLNKSLEHVPTLDNPAHSEVVGKMTNPERKRLAQMAKLILVVGPNGP